MLLPLKRVLAPTDFSQPSFEALKAASELARHFGAELLVAYVVPPVPALPPDPNYTFEVPRYEEALLSNAEARLREAIERENPEGLQFRTLIAYGDAANEILRLAEAERCDLVVIATHGHTGWRHLVFGSVTDKVVRAASCPVLTFRAQQLKE